MPIQITSVSFDNNAFGTSTSFYQANAGDDVYMYINIRSQIRISSVNNPLTLDPSLNIITSPTISWLDEGFRVGDWVRVTNYTSGGSVIYSFYSKIVYLDDTQCDFTSMPFFYDISANEIFEIYALDNFGSATPPPAGFYTARRRSDLDVLVNHVKNNLQGNEFSLIDGEATRFIFSGVETMLPGDTLTGTPVGNQSGQFVEAVTFKRLGDDADYFNPDRIVVKYAQSGIYDESVFDFSYCLKMFVKASWASISGEPFSRGVVKYELDANTGWFNEANNTSIVDSTLVQGCDEVEYCNTTTHSVIVDGGTPGQVAIGSAYISTDDLYYRNRTFNQLDITMAIPSVLATPGTFGSFTNEFGAGYDINVIAVTTIGTQTTIDFEFIPNANFDTFMSGRQEGDRLFYIWVKCGNVNHLVFADQLTCAPPIGGALDMVRDYGFLDHSQNITEIDQDQTGFIADTEDDIAYYGEFLLDFNQECERFTVRIEAYNTSTDTDFTLQETIFAFGGVQISGSGEYLLNLTQNVVTTLPNTSQKISAIFKRQPLIDTPTQYGVSIYYPFLLNWRYWLAQQNASVDFFPTQDKNWEQYDNLGDWQLRIELELIKDGLAFVHTNVFVDEPYDNDPNIESKIDLIRDIDNTNVSVIPEGELMRIRATHIDLTGTWDPLKTWGMITIEPKESSPRWICSTIVPFDNNTNNPLTSLQNDVILINYPASNIAVMECYFDSSKINLSNGVKITSKIKQACFQVTDEYKLTTEGLIKLTTEGIKKIKS